MSVTVIADEREPAAGLLPDGRPDPEYARALGLLPAPLGRRAAAFAIDAVILILLALPFALFGPAVSTALAAGEQPGPISIALSIVSLVLVNALVIVQLALHGRKGFTIGKLFLRVRTVNVKTLARPGFWWIVLRALIVQVAYSVVPILGAIPFLASPLFDAEKRNRSWHDKLTGTWLVDIVDGLDPYDAKALRHARREYDKPIGSSTGLPSLATGAVREAPFVPGARLGSAVVGGPSAGAVDAPPLVPASLSTPPAPTPPAATTPPAAVTPAPARPAVSPTPPVSASSTPGAAVLTFDDGSRYQVTGTGLIGRNPAPKIGELFDGMLAIVDSTASMSKTHAAYRVDATGFWINDRASTNGTRVRESTGALLEASSEPIAVPWGATVLLGDRYFVVNRA